MEPPDPSAAYLARCVECFLVAVGEAHALVLKGDVGGRLDNALRFASDLLEIIEDRSKQLEKESVAYYSLDDMREQLGTLQHLRAPAATLHRLTREPYLMGRRTARLDDLAGHLVADLHARIVLGEPAQRPPCSSTVLARGGRSHSG